jgi:hypothetical protein
LATSDNWKKPVPLLFVVCYPGEFAPIELPANFAAENQPPVRP